jgi:outer membrane protein assembly factor BamE (lipoprotein component of BamABCDE complex)
MYKNLLFICLTSLMFVSGCTSQKKTHGRLYDTDDLARLHIGSDRMSDVSGLMGSPHFTDPLHPGVWYYTGRKTKQKAFLSPKVSESQTLRLTFKEGILRTIDTINTHPATESVKDSTASSSDDLSFTQQMSMQFNRFAARSRARKREAEKQ